MTMPAPSKPGDQTRQRRTVVDQSRNERQKAVLLSEVARIGQGRSARATAESRKLCDHAQGLQIKRRGSKGA